MDDLLLKIETGEADSFESVSRSVLQRFRNLFNIRVSVEQAPAASLPRYEFKARRYKREDSGVGGQGSGTEQLKV
jgi:hypothetical protein